MQSEENFSNDSHARVLCLLFQRRKLNLLSFRMRAFQTVVYVYILYQAENQQQS